MDIQERLEYAIGLFEKTLAELDRINDRYQSPFMSTEQACEMIGCSRKTLLEYRRDHWKKGIHYFPQDQKVLYNRELIQDWVINRDCPDAHLRAIEVWSSRQLSNQSLKRGRKAG